MSYGNVNSKAQMERGAYDLDLSEPCSEALPNYTPRDQLMSHLNAFVAEHRIGEHIRYSTEVTKVSQDKTDYALKWQNADAQGELTGFGAVLCFPGFLPKPREEELPGQDLFAGDIVQGPGGCIAAVRTTL